MFSPFPGDLIDVAPQHLFATSPMPLVDFVHVYLLFHFHKALGQTCYIDEQHVPPSLRIPGPQKFPRLEIGNVHRRNNAPAMCRFLGRVRPDRFA